MLMEQDEERAARLQAPGCPYHQGEAKQDLFSDGVLRCESCYIEALTEGFPEEKAT